MFCNSNQIMYRRAFFILLQTFNAVAMETYSFKHNSNGSIHFNHTLISDQEFFNYELFSLGKSKPFCIDGEIYRDGLQHGQRHRFTVTTSRDGNSVSIIIRIREVQEMDSEVYIMSLTEGDNLHFIYDAHIDVVVPPSKAECRIQISNHAEYSTDWREVHCNATKGSEDGGSIACYQDAIRAPFKHPPRLHGNQVKTVFWMIPRLPINCCSFDDHHPTTAATCRDFSESRQITTSIIAPTDAVLEYPVTSKTKSELEDREIVDSGCASQLHSKSHAHFVFNVSLLWYFIITFP